MDGRLLGIVRVPLSHLSFREDLAAREFDGHISEYLEPKIRDNPQQDDCRNRVIGVVDDARLSLVLADLGVSSEQLEETLWTSQYPCLLNQFIDYIHGQHRIEAAKAALGEEALWTVELRGFYDLSYVYLSQNGYIRNKIEQYAYETKYDDGYIYLKIRQYQDAGDTSREAEWRHRLQNWENRAVDMIIKRHYIRDILDRLRPFRGLWSGMKLGIYREYFALDCDKEIYTYLNRIFATWSDITSGDPTLQSCVDVDTVRTLQRCAPCASERDRKEIDNAFAQRGIFSRVTDPQRRSQVRQNILGTSVVIPSFTTFHENMTYFSIAVRIIRSLIFPEEFLPKDQEAGSRKTDRLQRKHIRRQRRQRRRRHKEKGKDEPLKPLSEALHNCWVPPRDPTVEISEGEFRPLAGPASFDLMYQQLILAIFRRFPYLNFIDRPNIDCDGVIIPSEKPSCRSLFYRRAKLLGFKNKQIEQEATAIVSEDVSSGALRPMIQDWRSGKPETRTFRAIERVAFLSQLVGQPAESNPLSVSFVIRDLIQAFLGPFSFEIDWKKPQISLNYRIFDRAVISDTSLRVRQSHPPPIQYVSPVEFEIIPEPEVENIGDTLMEGVVSDMPNDLDISVDAAEMSMERSTREVHPEIRPTGSSRPPDDRNQPEAVFRQYQPPSVDQESRPSWPPTDQSRNSIPSRGSQGISGRSVSPKAITTPAWSQAGQHSGFSRTFSSAIGELSSKTSPAAYWSHVSGRPLTGPFGSPMLRSSGRCSRGRFPSRTWSAEMDSAYKSRGSSDEKTEASQWDDISLTPPADAFERTGPNGEEISRVASSTSRSSWISTSRQESLSNGQFPGWTSKSVSPTSSWGQNAQESSIYSQPVWTPLSLASRAGRLRLGSDTASQIFSSTAVSPHSAKLQNS